ncbi:MAG: aminotransferase class III-fold pyridoxal phosphate-dependent enzyme [Gammaproteobacteria bacterium]
MTLKSVTQCLANDFNLSGELKELYSYQDQSFSLQSNTPDGARYVVKVMHAETDPETVDMQATLLDSVGAYFKSQKNPPGIARIVRTSDGRSNSTCIDPDGRKCIVWVVTYLHGVLAADQQPYTTATISNLGSAIAHLHQALKSVDHPGLHRDFSWKLAGANWITEHRSELLQAYPAESDWLEMAIDTYLDPSSDGLGNTALESLEQQAIHGDINDHNVIFSPPAPGDFNQSQSITGIIDFGDAHASPRICDVAIAATYFMMNQENPWIVLNDLVAGYHSVIPLTRKEQTLLMPLVRFRIVQSLTHSMLKSRTTEDSYVTISQQPALKLIEQLSQFKPEFAQFWVHDACGDTYLTDKLERLTARFTQTPPAPVVDFDLRNAAVLDLSPESGHPTDPFSGDMPDPVADRGESAEATLGRYGEPRLVYQSAEFKSSSHPAGDARTIHAGVDVFAQAGAPVYTPCDGIVHALENRTTRQDYGPTVVLRHDHNGDDFYTLYGHLDSECLERLTLGDKVTRGQRIARIGAPPENGDWPPHLHFQWVLEDFNWGTDVNGVCHRFSWPVWKHIFPNPAILLNCTPSVEHSIDKDDALHTRRKEALGDSLSVSYSTPVQTVRGWKQFLYDQYGRCYLDAYNNVPHVGHCHPHVTAAVARQLTTLSTNTRYLHKNIIDYAEALTAKFDERLSVAFLVNSASEANELALRLARNYTDARDMIVMQDAYHGHTTSLIDISPYKAESRGGKGCPDWVHQVPAVDLYRGKFRYGNKDAGELYAQDVKQVIGELNEKQRSLCGFICESLPSVGGQLVYPEGYLKRVYAQVRDAGGVCIADEVQTGFGRTGDYFWGFEQQQVDPDIVVLGKPIGNGFPLAAVITTTDIAEKFNNGMEFFSTFGGNTVACAAGLAVLEVVEKENVQGHIKDVGDYLKIRLNDTIGDHPLIGDIRGLGLFMGVELVTDKNTLTPATVQASCVKNRLRELGVLIGTDGPHDNVLKIRPPSPFNRQDADYFVDQLAHVLQDTSLGKLASSGTATNG